MPDRPIRTVLVANRGEIACRVMRTLGELGLRSIAVYSDADADARHVRAADAAVRLGPAPAIDSYLDIDAVIEAARRTATDAIHPGYGFLSENAAFARACGDAGIVFIGPSASTIETMGDKIAAKAAVSARGVPVVPGLARRGLTDDELIDAAADIGFPVLVKPSAGGGGKGMWRVDDPTGLPAALASARRESVAAFGDDTLFLERFIDAPRHIEVQILADAHGTIRHLGERECSLQRRYQKVIEEAPSPLLDAATRERIGESACAAARSVGYVGAGTVEFIVSAKQPDTFFFMEMNTRLQVEHPVTELVTGVDLVAWQVRIAAGERLDLDQAGILRPGHAIEARVYAEDPAHDFLPTGGRVLALREPTGPNTRIDSGLRVGMTIGSHYDPMLAKVVAFGADRAAAVRNLDAALAGTAVVGVRTNIDFCRWLLNRPEVIAGDLDTGLLERTLSAYRATPPPDPALIAVAMARTEERWTRVPAERRSLWDVPNGWRLGRRAEVWTRLAAGPGTEPVTVGLQGTPQDATVTLGSLTIGGTERPQPLTTHSARVARDGELLRLTVDGQQQAWLVRHSGQTWWVHGDGGTWELRQLPLIDPRVHGPGVAQAELRSPMPGSVIAIAVADGDKVAVGDPVVTVEAMKMEHTLRAPVAGVVTVSVRLGAQTVADQVLARVTSPDEGASRVGT